MKTNLLSIGGVSVVTIALGLLGALLALAVLSGIEIPLISGYRTALVAFVVLGMAVCSAGLGWVASKGAWLHPLSVLGYILGGSIPLLVLAVLTGLRLPVVSSDRQAFVAAVILAAFKIGLTGLHRLL